MFTLDEADDDYTDTFAFLRMLDALFLAGRIRSYSYQKTPDGVFVYVKPIKAAEYIVLNLQIS